MTKSEAVKLFEEKPVRAAWDDEKEKWYFSITDVVSVLTGSPNPRKYWSVLKTRLKQEERELTTICSQLKMPSADGKLCKTDVADTEQLFRVTQCIPSPKAESFKLWLAQVARLDPKPPSLAVKSEVTNTGPGRLPALDYCRAMAMFLIVLFHVLYLVFRQLPHLYGGLGALADSGTALFVTLAGCLCQHQSKHFHYWRFLYKKLLTVLLPYAIATVLLVMLRELRAGNSDAATIGKDIMLSVIFGRGAVHLWFIPMILVFFLFTPLTLCLTIAPWRFAVIVPLLALSLYAGRGSYHGLAHNMLFFLPMYLLGMCYALDYDRWSAWLLRFLPALALACLLLFILACARPDASFVQSLCRYVFCLGIIAATTHYVRQRSLSNGLVSCSLGVVAATSMGIYFYHNSFIGLIVAPLFRRFVNGLSEPLVLLATLIATLVTIAVMSLLVLTVQAVLRRLGVKNTRWLIA